jgi:hypothetical protein
MSDGAREKFDIEGVPYRSLIDLRPGGYRAIWTCEACNVAETWGHLESAAHANDKIQAGVSKHHAEKHASPAP